MFVLLNITFFVIYASLPQSLTGDCQRSPWLDLAFWAISGGVISGLMQLISENMGNKQLRLAYKKITEENKDLRKKLDILFDRKEMYKDAVDIIESKIELFEKLISNVERDEQCHPCSHLISEVHSVIKKVKPGNPTGNDQTFSITQKNNNINQE